MKKSYRETMLEETTNLCSAIASGTREGESLGKLTKAKEKRIARMVRYWARARK